jgi:ketosteroid isomerase-like protein
MSTHIRTLIERGLQAFEQKDAQALTAIFSDDAVFYDPHYPTPEMRGQAAIRQGFEFAFGTLKQPGFTIRNFWGNEHSGVVEVDTHHVLQDGVELRFPQTFVVEERDGLVTRFQAYLPYPPPALAG